MKEAHHRTPATPDAQQLQDVMNAYPLEDDPKPLPPAIQLQQKVHEARSRMHLHRLKKLSSEAIQRAYPNLINIAHYADVQVLDLTTGKEYHQAGFSLWTAEGHMMLADGTLVRRLQPAEPLTEYYHGLVTVTDQEINVNSHTPGYSDYLRTSLSKTLDSLAHTIPVPSNKPTEWTTKKVSRATLRQKR